MLEHVFWSGLRERLMANGFQRSKVAILLDHTMVSRLNGEYG
jgi:hypothetical protein